MAPPPPPPVSPFSKTVLAGKARPRRAPRHPLHIRLHRLASGSPPQRAATARATPPTAADGRPPARGARHPTRRAVRRWRWSPVEAPASALKLRAS
jgi:hypothetical protein